MRRIAFSVEQRHIDAGTRRDCLGCPVSLALVEALKAGAAFPPRVSVWPSSLPEVPGRASIDGYPAKLPPAANAFALAFDRDQPVEPFEDTIFVEDMP